MVSLRMQLLACKCRKRLLSVQIIGAVSVIFNLILSRIPAFNHLEHFRLYHIHSKWQITLFKVIYHSVKCILRIVFPDWKRK